MNCQREIETLETQQAGVHTTDFSCMKTSGTLEMHGPTKDLERMSCVGRCDASSLAASIPRDSCTSEFDGVLILTELRRLCQPSQLSDDGPHLRNRRRSDANQVELGSCGGGDVGGWHCQ